MNFCFFIIIGLLEGIFSNFHSDSTTIKSADQDVISVTKQGFNKLNSSKHYQMDVSYPYVIYNIHEIEHKVNLDIQAIMANAISDFQEKLIKTIEDKGILGLSSLSLNYQLHYNHYNILSVSFEKNTFYNGYKGTRKLALTYNYDFERNKALNLDDFFKENKDYRSFIYQYIKSRVSKCKLKKDMLDQIYCVDNEGIIFIFDSISLKGDNCAASVKIPWEELEFMLNFEGPASNFFQ